MRMFSGWRVPIWWWLSQRHKREITEAGKTGAFIFKWLRTKQWPWWHSLYIGNKSNSNEILELLHQQERCWSGRTRTVISQLSMTKLFTAAPRSGPVEGEQHPQRLRDNKTRVRRSAGWPWEEVREVSCLTSQSVSSRVFAGRQTGQSQFPGQLEGWK